MRRYDGFVAFLYPRAMSLAGALSVVVGRDAVADG
jgi:hypothetical protein